jgi:hypothetical protein
MVNVQRLAFAVHCSPFAVRRSWFAVRSLATKRLVFHGKFQAVDTRWANDFVV